MRMLGWDYKQGSCTCYLGQKDTLCKHIVALALHAVMNGWLLNDKDKNLGYQAKCSRQQGALTKEELAVLKKSISASM